MPMDDQQKAERAEKIRQQAIHYAAHPEDGHRAGFWPKPRQVRDTTPTGSFDSAAPQVIPLDAYDWVLVIAQKQLGPMRAGGRQVWYAEPPIEGPESLVFEIL